MTEKAQRINKNKIELSQCPPEIVWAIASVLMKSDKKHGGKYDTGNWKKGSEFTQLLDCMERHFSKMKSGLDYDEEDGLPHSWHLATNVMFYIFNELYHPENDNRETGYVLDPEVFSDFLKQGVNKEEAKSLESAKVPNEYVSGTYLTGLVGPMGQGAQTNIKVTAYKEGTNYSVSSGTIPCDGNPEFNINKKHPDDIETRIGTLRKFNGGME